MNFSVITLYILLQNVMQNEYCSALYSNNRFWTQGYTQSLGKENYPSSNGTFTCMVPPNYLWYKFQCCVQIISRHAKRIFFQM